MYQYVPRKINGTHLFKQHFLDAGIKIRKKLFLWCYSHDYNETNLEWLNSIPFGLFRIIIITNSCRLWESWELKIIRNSRHHYGMRVTKYLVLWINPPSLFLDVVLWRDYDRQLPKLGDRSSFDRDINEITNRRGNEDWSTFPLWYFMLVCLWLYVCIARLEKYNSNENLNEIHHMINKINWQELHVGSQSIKYRWSSK